MEFLGRVSELLRADLARSSQGLERGTGHGTGIDLEVLAQGGTPLPRHLGSRCRRQEIVVVLLTSGADVNAADKQGRTVRHGAARHNLRDPLAELLRKHGALD
ncbi:MAG: hypothetical protein ACYS15_06795 [Planctomycetota bacterium]